MPKYDPIGNSSPSLVRAPTSGGAATSWVDLHGSHRLIEFLIAFSGNTDTDWTLEESDDQVATSPVSGGTVNKTAATGVVAIAALKSAFSMRYARVAVTINAGNVNASAIATLRDDKMAGVANNYDVNLS